MKSKTIFVAAALLLVLLAGFAGVRAEGAWEQITAFNGEMVTIAGFLDNSFGISVDSNGESQYTEDGGRRVAERDEPTPPPIPCMAWRLSIGRSPGAAGWQAGPLQR